MNKPVETEGEAYVRLFMQTKTKQDAHVRITNAKFGALAGEPSEEYLTALRAQLYSFIGDVEEKLFRLWAKEVESE